MIQLQMKALEKEVSALKGKLASSQTGNLVAKAVDVNGTKLLAAELEGLDSKGLQSMIALLKDKLKSGVVVLAAVDAGKVQLAVGVTSDLTAKVKAGELVNFVAGQVGGKGGGKPDLAMAGGTDASKLAAALQSVQAWVAAKL
jgi:alanyl-tRNA synthetase